MTFCLAVAIATVSVNAFAKNNEIRIGLDNKSSTDIYLSRSSGSNLSICSDAKPLKAGNKISADSNNYCIRDYTKFSHGSVDNYINVYEYDKDNKGKGKRIGNLKFYFNEKDNYTGNKNAISCYANMEGSYDGKVTLSDDREVVDGGKGYCYFKAQK
tara:strand:- start:21456 stop:21926 length:471 start_codon:yes stop_codon:yes gene_type:complete